MCSGLWGKVSLVLFFQRQNVVLWQGHGCVWFLEGEKKKTPSASKRSSSCPLSFPLPPRNQALSSFIALSQISENSLTEHSSQTKHDSHLSFAGDIWSEFLEGNKAKAACMQTPPPLPRWAAVSFLHSWNIAARCRSEQRCSDEPLKLSAVFFQFGKLLLWPWQNYSSPDSSVTQETEHTSKSEANLTRKCQICPPRSSQIILNHLQTCAAGLSGHTSCLIPSWRHGGRHVTMHRYSAESSQHDSVVSKHGSHDACTMKPFWCTPDNEVNFTSTGSFFIVQYFWAERILFIQNYHENTPEMRCILSDTPDIRCILGHQVYFQH